MVRVGRSRGISKLTGKPTAAVTAAMTSTATRHPRSANIGPSKAGARIAAVPVPSSITPSASPRALWGASLGTIVGLFFGLPGLLIGPFLGALAGELSSGRELDQATRVGIGTWIGLLFGTLAKLALCFTMLGVFALAFVLG